MLTAISAEVADSTDQTWATMRGRSRPSMTSASRPAARLPVSSVASIRSTATPQANTGSVPAAVSSASAAWLVMAGIMASPETMASSAATPQAAPINHGSSCRLRLTRASSRGTVGAAMRAANIAIQSLPRCTASAAADSASMKPMTIRSTPWVMTGASPISGTSTSSPRCSEFQRRASARPAAPTAAAIASPAAAGTQR